jgi:hypothetical protein
VRGSAWWCISVARKPRPPTDELLLFGTSGDTAAIEQIPVGDGFGRATPVLRAHEGDWIGVMVANRDRVVYGKVLTESRARLVSDDAAKRRDFEPAVAAAPLGWRPDGKFVVWNRTNLEIREPGGASTMLNIALPHEPQSATFAGDLMLVTMRGTTGRAIAAYDLAATAIDKMPRWNIAEGLALTVRCAGDVQPPCYIARRTAPDTYEIVPLDPATGTAGGEVRYHGQLEDEIVAAGTFEPNRYEVVSSTRAAFHTVLEADGELLSLARPSPDGTLQ